MRLPPTNEREVMLVIWRTMSTYQPYKILRDGELSSKYKIVTEWLKMKSKNMLTSRHTRLPPKDQREVILEIPQIVSINTYRAYVQHIMYIRIGDKIATV